MERAVIKSAGSSPHTRGAHRLARLVVGKLGIIPAYAGSTSSMLPSLALASDHPRIRGEHSLAGRPVRLARGSSPHTRGARAGHSGLRRRQRIIPAYAGSTPAGAGGLPSRRDHPRIRGEHGGQWTQDKVRVGSSPHTRGAHLEIPAIPRIAAVIIPVFLYPSPTPQEEADRSMVLLTLS